nr:Chain T, SPT16 [Saccharomyces cerevisiae]
GIKKTDDEASDESEEEVSEY